MTSRLSALLLSFFLFIVSLFVIFPTKVYANCNQTGCPTGQFCYPQSGLCIDNSKAPKTKDVSKPAYEEGCGEGSVNTAIGCISTSAEASNGFFSSIMKIFVGLGGGLALLLMLYGVFIVTTSAGIPDKLKEGSEIITSAIAGLIFVLLSVVLLNLIGINILGLPGLS